MSVYIFISAEQRPHVQAPVVDRFAAVATVIAWWAAKMMAKRVMRTPARLISHWWVARPARKMTIPGRRERGCGGEDNPALAVLGEPAEREEEVATSWRRSGPAFPEPASLALQKPKTVPDIRSRTVTELPLWG